MEIREFAERILFGDRWEDKLIALDRYEDGQPGTVLTTPDAPGRPQGLGLDEWHGRERMQFRDISKLHSEKDRGLVLHFFANHELLALELMALALLKFPDAPEKFRRGLVQTLRDEQQHVSLYRERMRQVGVEFGQIPVSDYFWKAIAPMSSPRDYVTGLSMTLEQANLDYAVHYAQVYDRLGDGETAAILQRVYKDEIGHVKYGLAWFQRWNEEGTSQWQAYVQALPSPLDPARAKGIGFNREGRLKAGLKPEYIDELEIFSRSRGRRPDVWWFNANCEAQVVHGREGYTPPKLAQQLERDLRGLPMLLCAPDDVVLVEQRPTAAFLRQMLHAGFALPEFVEYGDKGTEQTPLVERKLSGLKPWGWSPQSAAFLRPLAGNLLGAERVAWSGEMAALYSKAWSAEQLRAFLQASGHDWLCAEKVVGRGCSTVDEVAAQIEKLVAEGAAEIGIKAAVASSGREQIRCRGGSLREGQHSWLQNMLAKQGEVVVEPWLDKAMDLSLHFDIESTGSAKTLGWTRFFTDERGQYRGTMVGNLANGVDVELARFLYGGGRDPRRLQRLGNELAAFLAEPLAKAGYAGPVGVDALVYRDGKVLRLKPVVEINPRFTMGRVAFKLKPRVNSARTALWLVLSRCEVAVSGCASLAEMALRLQERWPVQLTKDGQLSGGALFTDDVSQARDFATVLIVGQTLAECRARWAEVGLVLGCE